MPTAAPVDLRRSVATYAARRGRIDLVTVAPARYLAVDGAGDPNTSPAFADALASLYPLAYTLKFASRAAGRDYRIMPLEGLWWAGDMAAFGAVPDKGQWLWTLLIAVPDWTTPDDLAAARASVAGRGGAPALDAVRLETLDEGLVVQTLHVGPFDAEGPTIEALHEQAASEGLELAGRHHEIYLSDFRRTAPDRLRTIVRQPVRARS